jgi:hypothetical protein
MASRPIPQRVVVFPGWAPRPLPLDARHVEQHQGRPAVGKQLSHLRRAQLREVKRLESAVVLKRGRQPEGEHLRIPGREALGPVHHGDVILFALDELARQHHTAGGGERESADEGDRGRPPDLVVRCGLKLRKSQGGKKGQRR